MEEEPIPDIKDITPPASFPLDHWEWTPFNVALILGIVLLTAMAIAGVIMLVMFIQWLIRRARLVKHRHAAIADLNQLSGAAATIPVNQFSSKLVAIVKKYFHRRYRDRLLFQTSQEFERRDKIGWEAPEGQRERLQELLTRCDHLSYGSEPASEDRRRELVKEAIHILTEEPADALPAS